MDIWIANARYFLSELILTQYFKILFIKIMFNGYYDDNWQDIAIEKSGMAKQFVGRLATIKGRN